MFDVKFKLTVICCFAVQNAMHRFAFFLVADIRERPGDFWLELPCLVGVLCR